MLFAPDLRDIHFIEQVKNAIRTLDLKREVIFVPNKPPNRFSQSRSHRHCPASWVKISIRIKNRRTNFSRSMTRSVGREIRSEKSAASAHHVASGATRLSEKQRFPATRVTPVGRRSAALQSAQVIYKLLPLLRIESSAKSRHSGAGNPALDYIGNGTVRHSLHSRQYIRRAIPAARIQSVAACAMRFEQITPASALRKREKAAGSKQNQCSQKSAHGRLSIH